MSDEAKPQKNPLDGLKKKIPFQWRVQAFYPRDNPTSCQCVAYIDARDVMALLDDVVGPDKWMSDYRQVGDKVYGGIGIHTDHGWVWKWDCGTETDIEGEKGQASDAFKRAAVKWGVGRFLYDMGLQRLSAKPHGRSGVPIDHQGNPIRDLTQYINDMLKTPAQKHGIHSQGIPFEEHKRQMAAQEAAKNGQPVPPEPPKPDSHTVTGYVKNVTSKSGPKKDGSMYTRYSIQIASGVFFTTFEDDFAKVADKSLQHGLEVEIEYKTNGRWNDVVKMRLTDDAAAEDLDKDFSRRVANY